MSCEAVYTQYSCQHMWMNDGCCYNIPEPTFATRRREFCPSPVSQTEGTIPFHILQAQIDIDNFLVKLDYEDCQELSDFGLELIVLDKIKGCRREGQRVGKPTTMPTLGFRGTRKDAISGHPEEA